MNAPAEPLALELYVQILAEVLVRGAAGMPGILGRLNVSAEQFRLAEEHWTLELAQCLPKRKGVIAMNFATAFAEARRRAGLLDPMAGERPAGVLPPVAAPAAAVPSYLLDSGPKPTAMHPFAALSAPAPTAAAAPPMPALAPMPAPAPPTAAVDPHNQTRTFNPDRAHSPALPFAPASGAPVLAAPDSTPAGPRIDTGTAALFDDPSSPGTPWSGAGLPMPIETYAALTVELAKKPPVAPGVVLQRYGFTNAQEFRELDATMKAAIQRHAGLRGQYQMLVMRLSAAGNQGSR